MGNVVDLGFFSPHTTSFPLFCTWCYFASLYIEDKTAGKAAGVMAMVGVITIPHYSLFKVEEHRQPAQQSLQNKKPFIAL
jgi:hypothetical protein